MATGGVANAASRDYISIVGSSTVFPFATVGRAIWPYIFFFRT
ncbi:hypothetical protein [Vibrio fortis]|nr:hypothetical protein [Vibrio fortis]